MVGSVEIFKLEIRSLVSLLTTTTMFIIVIVIIIIITTNTTTVTSISITIFLVIL
jgi:hypothetical protein